MIRNRMSPTRRRADGERIGAFEIVRYLASGGMGDVYVGRHVETGEEVALKFLGDSSPASIERFEREGRIASSLKHRNIVGGRGYGRTSDGVAYIAMELLRGEDLDRRIASAGISPAEMVRVAIHVCDALEAAHAKRIVHRDLKPQNVFLCEGPDALVKVLDFGIARLADERRMTGTGMLIGTWSYMSPEQARAEPDIDARTDLWSLGVVLYETLAGRPPFDAPTAPGTLYQILFDAPPPLAKVAPHLPPDLCAVVHRALQKARDERYADAAAMRGALASVDASALTEPRRPISIRPASLDTDATVDGTGLDVTMMSDATRAPATVENRLTSVAFLRGAREQALVEDVARQLQGRVVSLVGDGLLVVFGFDRWNGDEPERAVRLAAAIRATVTSVGIATGRAVRSSAQVAGAAVDAAVALSRRGDGIIVDTTTASIVRGGYDAKPLGDGAVRVEPSVSAVRDGALEPAYTTPFVGRDVECAMLVQVAEAVASDAQPQGCIVLGAVGMGKSRLRHEAVERVIASQPDVTVLTARCEAFRRDSPFAPIMDALRGVVDASVVKIFTAVGEGAGDPVAAMDRARGSLEAILRGLGQNAPVVLAIDDAQWLDGPSQTAIRQVCENAPDLPLAIWLFGRPEAREAAQRVLSGASVVELKPLAKPAAEKLLRAVAGEVDEQVLERAGGQPLFLEELGRLHAARGEGGENARSALPPSIEGAHLAQLDQLESSDREFVKRAAVFGRSAWLDGVVSLGAEGAALDRLKRAQMLVQRPRSRFEFTKEFSFRSAVLQEVAYGLWPEVMRPRLHERVASWLAARDGVGADEIAQHWELAGETAKAAEAFAAAAEISSMVSDTATTVAQVDRALALTEEPSLRWRALVARDVALQLAGDRELQRRGLTEMASLAERLGPSARAEVAWRQCYFARMTGDREGTLEAGARALALAAEAGDARWGSNAHNELALMLAHEGRFGEAAEHALGARKLANETPSEWLRARAIGTQVYVAMESGNVAQAVDLFELSAARYQRAGDRRREALALANAASVMLDLGRLAESAARLESAIDASKRVGNARTVAVATHNLGVIRRLEARLDEAQRHQEFALRESRRLNHPRLEASGLAELVRLAIARGTLADGFDPSLAAMASSDATRSPNLIAAALATRIQLTARAGTSDAQTIERARTVLNALDKLPLARAELAAALFEVDPTDGTLRDAFETALTQFAEPLDTPEDRDAFRATFARRCQIDPRLVA
jgi:tetratricopeptide (TPR) repeat protein